MKDAARPGRPFVFRSRKPVDTEAVSAGPTAWQKLRDEALSFQAKGHTASTATIAENLFRTRRKA